MRERIAGGMRAVFGRPIGAAARAVKGELDDIAFLAGLGAALAGLYVLAGLGVALIVGGVTLAGGTWFWKHGVPTRPRAPGA